MLVYFLIGLSLVLLGIAGLQFSYMFYIERMYRERRSYLRELEQKYARVKGQLAAAEARIAEQDEVLEGLQYRVEMDEETWADVIDDR